MIPQWYIHFFNAIQPEGQAEWNTLHSYKAPHKTFRSSRTSFEELLALQKARRKPIENTKKGPSQKNDLRPFRETHKGSD